MSGDINIIEKLRMQLESGIDCLYFDDDDSDDEENGNCVDNIEVVKGKSEDREVSAEEKLPLSAKIVEDNDFRDKNFSSDVISFIKDARKQADSVESLVNLQEIVQNFDGCYIKKAAKNTVFSDGSPNSGVIFVGEAPGANEDEKGIPFCGRSGDLLDKMMGSIGLDRKLAYITNTVFWRPPGNRRPTMEEIEMCRPFVEKHIALVNPKVIFLLGATALCSLMGVTESISKIRGKTLQYTNKYIDGTIPVIPSFHPAYLLRQSSQKKFAWEDLKKLKEILK